MPARNGKATAPRRRAPVTTTRRSVGRRTGCSAHRRAAAGLPGPLRTTGARCHRDRLAQTRPGGAISVIADQRFFVLRPLGEPSRAVCRNPSDTPAFCRLAALRVDFRDGCPAAVFSSSWKPACAETRAAWLCVPRDGCVFFSRGVRLGPDRSAALRYRSAFVAMRQRCVPRPLQQAPLSVFAPAILDHGPVVEAAHRACRRPWRQRSISQGVAVIVGE